eukprot:1145413-Pelagomonas_calceolata.AAC.9
MAEGSEEHTKKGNRVHRARLDVPPGPSPLGAPSCTASYAHQCVVRCSAQPASDLMPCFQLHAERRLNLQAPSNQPTNRPNIGPVPPSSGAHLNSKHGVMCMPHHAHIQVNCTRWTCSLVQLPAHAGLCVTGSHVLSAYFKTSWHA